METRLIFSGASAGYLEGALSCSKRGERAIRKWNEVEEPAILSVTCFLIVIPPCASNAQRLRDFLVSDKPFLRLREANFHGAGHVLLLLFL